MGRYKDYEPMYKDAIDYNLCKYYCNEVCCNAECEYVADFPRKEICLIDSPRRCRYFKKETGVILDE